MMEDVEGQDIYTCGVCLQKIHFQDLTSHVFLHDDYTAFSYDEATKVIEPITEAAKKSLEGLQVTSDQIQEVEDPNQAYNLASTASALVDLSTTPDQAHDTANILYETVAADSQHTLDATNIAMQAGFEPPTSSILSIASSMQHQPTDAGPATLTRFQSIPISSLLSSTANLGQNINVNNNNQNAGIVGIQTHPSDEKKVQYVTIQKPVRTAAVRKEEKQPPIKTVGQLLGNAGSSVGPKTGLSTLNEIFVWNKGRDLIPGEVITNVHVPVIQNGVSKLTECSIVFQRCVDSKLSDEATTKPVKVRLDNANQHIEEVQSVDDLEDMDFEMYMDVNPVSHNVTYKTKAKKKPTNRSAKFGRQMENYKWKDAVFSPKNVAKELRKSIVPNMIKGSPAVAKYLQAMDISTDELGTELLAQMTSDQSQNTLVAEPTMNQEQAEAAASTYHIVTTEGDDQQSEQNPQIIVTEAMNALAEASEMRENGDIEGTGQSVEELDANTTEGETVGQPVNDTTENSDQLLETGAVVDTEESESNHPMIEIVMDADNVQPDDTDTAEEIDANNVEVVESETTGGDNDCAITEIKLDGTSDNPNIALRSGSGESGNVTPARKSFRLEIKKLQKGQSSSEEPTPVSLVKVEELSEEEKSELQEIGEEVPNEIASFLQKKYGYYCSICQTKLPPDTVLKEHLESHRIAKKRNPSKDIETTKSPLAAQPNKVFLYYCSLCNKMFPSEAELKQHCKQHKAESEEDKNSSLEDQMDDSDMEENEDSYEVKKSPSATSGKRVRKKTAKVLEAEAESAKRPKRVSRVSETERLSLQCDVCQKVLNSRSSLYQHKKTHEEKETDLTHHKCPLGCGQRFRTVMEVDLHGPFCLRNTETNLGAKPEDESAGEPEDTTCPYCRRVCESSSSMKYHSLVCPHRPYDKCPHCDFVCKGTLPMSKHQVKVHNMKPFKCDQCDRTFQLRGSLRDHVRSQHTESKYECEHCGKKFPKNNVYKRHVFIQHGGFRYPCNYCSKKFKDKRCWRIHENSHKGAYEYSCIQCKRSFSKAPDYKQHMLEVHDIDGKAALDLNKVTKELRLKLCKIGCPLCKEKFPLESAFLQHLQNQHEFSYDEALEEYQKVSGSDDATFVNEFEEIQKGGGTSIDNA